MKTELTNGPPSEVTPVDAFLATLSAEIREAVGEHLQSIVVYGAVVKGDYVAGASDVDVMVVLDGITVDLLDELAPIFRRAQIPVDLAPLVLAEDDLRRSTDVFPIKFLDMQRFHSVLSGRDVLTDLSISREHLRLRCEQEIKNLLLRLRQFYLRRSWRTELVSSTLQRAISPLLADLAVLVELKSGQVPASRAEIIDLAGELGLDHRVLRDAYALKVGDLKPDAAALRRLYGSFMATVGQAAALVDQL